MNTDIIQRYDMLPRGGRILCAVSGGSDSMSLLHFLKSHEKEFEIEVLAAHYEHGLRGEESLRDCAFVENWCREHGIAFYCEHGKVQAYADEKGLSTEEAARELRYAFLEKTAEKLGCSRIATAHNADDNAETVLFNLCRGSGGKGLCGIPPVRGNIVRPLLWVSRSEIEKYLEAEGVPHVEDSTNSENIYRRNIIRHRVMPVLREINSGFSEAVRRSCMSLREDEECLEKLAEKFISQSFDGDSLPLEDFRELPRAVAARVLRRLCPQTLSREHVEAAVELAKGGGLRFLDLPGCRLRCEQGRLYFGESISGKIEEHLIVPGEICELPEAGLRLITGFSRYNGEINNKFKTYLFKYESICGNIICTARRSGDSISPQGRNCSKSLKKLFTEAKMTQAERDLTPVLRDDRGVIAVLGLAVDKRCTPQRGDRVLRIDIEKM